MEAKESFSDDGKERISIVISLDFTQDVSRIKHRKPGSKAASQESLFLMGRVLTAIYGWMAEPSPLSDFKTLPESYLPFDAFSWMKPGCNQRNLQ